MHVPWIGVYPLRRDTISNREGCGSSLAPAKQTEAQFDRPKRAFGLLLWFSWPRLYRGDGRPEVKDTSPKAEKRDNVKGGRSLNGTSR